MTEVLQFPTETLLLLFTVALLAGCLDTLAGGGGLISLPALILAGLPPINALATNKLQGCTGTCTASFMMLRHKRLHWRQVRLPMLTAFIGAALGTLVIQTLDTSKLTLVVPLVLLLIALYFLFSGKMLEHVHPLRLSPLLYRTLIIPLIGVYDGMFGPGTGSFFSLSGVALQGRKLIDATAHAKTLNFATNIASLLVFLFAGHVVWQAGLVMMCGQLLGAWTGSHLLFRIHPGYIRLLVVAISLLMLGTYLLRS